MELDGQPAPIDQQPTYSDRRSLSFSRCLCAQSDKLPVTGLPHSLLYNVAVLSIFLDSPHVAERLYEVNIVVTVENDAKTGQLTRQLHAPY